MRERIKQFVKENRTLIVVIVGVIVICFVHWWFCCKNKAGVNKIDGGQGWKKLRLSMYIFEKGGKHFIKVGKVGNVNKDKELCESLSHADEIDGLFNNYYLYVDIAYWKGNPEDDYHKCVVYYFMQIVGPENFEQWADGGMENNLNAENYTITAIRFNDLKYYAMLFDQLAALLASGGRFRVAYANTLGPNDSPDLTNLQNLPNGTGLPKNYFISPVTRLPDLSDLMSGTALCTKKLWEITGQIPVTGRIEPGFGFFSSGGVEEFVSLNQHNPSFLLELNGAVARQLKEIPTVSPPAFFKYLYSRVEESEGLGEVVGLFINTDPENPQVLIKRRSLTSICARGVDFFDELFADDTIFDLEGIKEDGWKLYDFSIRAVSGFPELEEDCKGLVEASITRELLSAPNSQTGEAPDFIEKQVMMINLGFGISQDWLLTLISKELGVREAEIKVTLRRGPKGESTGIARVQGTGEDLLGKIIKKFNGSEIGGRIVSVFWKGEKGDRRSTGIAEQEVGTWGKTRKSLT